MHGNVWEWCQDDWHGNYEGAPTDGNAWISEKINIKVMRGGSWILHPVNCRSAARFYVSPELANYTFGFRVVYTAS